MDSSNNYSNKKLYTIVSLFSGLGGMDLGFVGDFNYLDRYYAKNPFEVIFANDIFKQAADIYEANLKHHVKRKSITDLDFDTDLPKVEVDVVLGGFPCQSFSHAGKRKGLSDPRGQLYMHMAKVIEHYRPKMFVAENVDGLRTSRKGHAGEDITNSALDVILDHFRSLGYHLKYQVLNAADYGVPQLRKRVIIMGLRADLGSADLLAYPPVTNTEFPDAATALQPWVSAEQAIDDLWDNLNSPTIPNHTSKDVSRAKFYPGKRTQGNNRIAKDRPAPTIRAEHHGNIEAHYRTLLEDKNNMEGWRRLSVRECGRLQSFPDSFVFTASASSAYKAIGNAVPPVLAWHIAKCVAQTLDSLT